MGLMRFLKAKQDVETIVIGCTRDQADILSKSGGAIVFDEDGNVVALEIDRETAEKESIVVGETEASNHARRDEEEEDVDILSVEEPHSSKNSVRPREEEERGEETPHKLPKTTSLGFASLGGKGTRAFGSDTGAMSFGFAQSASKSSDGHILEVELPMVETTHGFMSDGYTGDLRDPGTVRDLMDQFVPPTVMASSKGKIVMELIDAADIDHFSAFVNYTISRQHICAERDDYKKSVGNFHGLLTRVQQELSKERKVASALRENNKFLVHKHEECTSLVSRHRREKDDIIEVLKKRDERIGELDLNLSGMNTQLQGKDEELVKLRAELLSSRESVKKLEEENKILKDELAICRQARRELLAIFPELFGRVLNHSDVANVLSDFNEATLAYGSHLAAELRPTPMLIKALYHFIILLLWTR